MKKILVLTSVLVLTACGTTIHNGKVGMTISNPDIEFIPQEAKVSINTNNKLSGSAECSSFLWIFNSTPERKTFGANMQTREGLIGSDDCIAAAVHDAMKNSDADIIVAPQYTTARNGVLCFGSRCLSGTTKILVKGYAGKITSITDMDRDVVHTKQKASSSKKSSGLF